MRDVKDKKRANQAHRLELQQEDKAFIFALISTALITFLLYPLRDLFSTPSYSASEDVCPIPKGSYDLTCTAISSNLLEDKCNFTAICDTNKGKKYGVAAINHFRFNQYGNECPAGLLLQQEIMLPAYAQFHNFINMRGKILDATKNAHKELYEHSIVAEYEDEKCDLRMQLAAAGDTSASTLSLALPVAAAALALKNI